MSEKKSTLMQKVQRFGGAMFTPVLFFAVFGIIVGFATLFKNNLVFGSLADPETTWYKVWDIIYNGANTVFKQMPLIFAIGLPVSLAKKQQAICNLCYLSLSDKFYFAVLGAGFWC